MNTNTQVQPTALVTSKIEFQAEMEDLFSLVVEKGKDELKKQKQLQPAAFIAVKDVKMDKINVMVIPMRNINPGDTHVFAQILKMILSSFKAAQGGNFQVMGLIMSVDAKMNLKKKEEVLNPDGSFNKDMMGPMEDKNSRDVIVFTLETKYKKRTLIHEYIASDENDIVLNEKPFVDDYQAYDSRTANLSDFAFLFTEPVDSN